MKKIILLVIGSLSVVAMSSAFAVKVDSIYEAGIPVASQTQEDRDKAMQAGLVEVLSKVSGETDVLDNETIKSKIQKADTFVQEFSYTDSSNTPNTPYVLRMSFEKKRVNHLLRQADLPVWGQDRPLILAWVEYEAPGNEPVIIDNDSKTEIQQVLTEKAQKRGLPIILPMMDVEDINQVNVSDIVSMTIPTLQDASQRYGSEVMLVTRILKQPAGYSIQSKMVIGERQYDWEVNENNLNDAIAALLDNVTDALAKRYASAITDTIQSEMTLKISHLSEDGDFAQVMDYITHLTTVADVEPIQIAANEATLKISLHGSKDAFIQALTVGQKLQPAIGSTETSPEYVWNR